MTRSIRSSLAGVLILIGISVLSLPSASMAQELSIKGTLKKGNGTFKDATVLLYKRNEVIARTEPNWLGNFSFELALDSHDTVEIRSEGHISKRVIFDTHIPKDIEDVDPSGFDFDVVMLEKRRVPEGETGIFDFPVGRVFFDPYEKEFRFNDSYTSRIRREFRKVLGKDEREVQTREQDTLKPKDNGS